jgi:penicillin-binding protein 2
MNSPSVNKYEVPFWRILLVYGMVVTVVGILAYRLFTLQVSEESLWMDQAVDNFTDEISDPASRGIIYDRNGYILASNVASYNVVITPAGLPDDEADIQRIYREVSKLTGVPAGGPVTDQSLANAKLYSACVPGPSIADMVALGDSLAPYTAVKISCNINEELARVIRERSVDWPGVTVEIEPVREYPTGSQTANIIGFLGPIPAALEDAYTERRFVANRDKVGYAGIETSMDDILLGSNGLRVVQKDVAGKVLRNIEPPDAPVAGNNVVLTIDTRLQQAAEAVLLDEIDYWNNRYYGYLRISSGVVIAMNPKTGEILAMVTYPTYENNRMARFIPGYYYDQLSKDPRHPLVNNAVSAEFPPGSTFKLSTATGAYNEEVVEPGDIIQTPGKLVLCERFRPTDPCTERNSRPFVDWIYERNGVINEAGFGALDFFRCIAYSSNVCFYKLGGGFEGEIEEGLGIFRLHDYARALGYGERSGIQLPGEEDGLIPTPQWKRINTGENWSTGDTYIASVGQGFVLGTPLQVMLSGATIANRGKLMQPTVIREIRDSDGRILSVWFDPSDFSLYELMQKEDKNGRRKDVWVRLDNLEELDSPPEGSYQISPFTPNMKWDVTTEPKIQIYDCEVGYCDPTEQYKVIQPRTIEAVRTGTHMAVTEDPLGTLHKVFNTDYPIPIAVAGKTGTAEYCDDVARAANRCQYGLWPTHAWTLAYAPFDDPEIIIIAFAYNAGEGGTVAAPIVARVMQAYFELKAIDLAKTGG